MSLVVSMLVNQECAGSQMLIFVGKDLQEINAQFSEYQIGCEELSDSIEYIERTHLVDTETLQRKEVDTKARYYVTNESSIF